MAEPVRVLQVVGNMSAGGLETLIMNWYRRIDKEKVQFDFLVHHSQISFYENEIQSLGGNVYHLTFSDDRNYIKYKKDLNEFFSLHPEYKVVHGHHSSFGSFYLSAAERAGVPCRISHSHIASFSKTLNGFLIFILSRKYGGHANYHFACSKAAGQYMYGKESKFSVINNGIDTVKFAFSTESRQIMRNELGIEDKIVIIHVGRFADQKNHSFLIDIFNELHKKRSDSVLLLAGIGPLQGKIRSKVDKLGLKEYVLFLNNRDDINNILNAADVFAFPSLYEGLPLTLVEAQASGLPVICSDKVTTETKLTERYYSLSLKMSPEKWACRILEMLNNTYNRSEAAVIVKSKQYDSEDVTNQMQDFYLKQYFN